MKIIEINLFAFSEFAILRTVLRIPRWASRFRADGIKRSRIEVQSPHVVPVVTLQNRAFKIETRETKDPTRDRDTKDIFSRLLDTLRSRRSRSHEEGIDLMFSGYCSPALLRRRRCRRQFN